MTRVVLGVDIGGTTTAAGLVTPEGAVLAELARPTHAGGAGSALATIEGVIEDMLGRAAGAACEVTGVGVGAPGVVDAEAGRTLAHVPHVPELANLPLAGMLADRFHLPVRLDNDVNALALAEWMFGEARGAGSFVLLAPGTGFGAAILIEGRLVRGVSGFGGELGHAPVKFDGRPCWCGGRGCLAVYASGRGIGEAGRACATTVAGQGMLALAGGAAGAITAATVFRAAEEGDPAAAEIVDEACQAMGAAIAIIVNGLNPEVLLVTGGVAASYARLDKRVMAAAADYCFKEALAATRLKIVAGDKRVTMRGAAAVVFYESIIGGRRP